MIHAEHGPCEEKYGARSCKKEKVMDPSLSEKVAFSGQDRHSAITITICVKAHPLIGHVPKDETLKGYGYRILVIESYLVFYVIRGRTIEIHQFVHGFRNLDDII
jgi:hypothetical protein